MAQLGPGGTGTFHYHDNVCTLSFWARRKSPARCEEPALVRVSSAPECYTVCTQSAHSPHTARTQSHVLAACKLQRPSCQLAKHCSPNARPMLAKCSLARPPSRGQLRPFRAASEHINWTGKRKLAPDVRGAKTTWAQDNMGGRQFDAVMKARSAGVVGWLAWLLAGWLAAFFCPAGRKQSDLWPSN